MRPTGGTMRAFIVVYSDRGTKFKVDSDLQVRKFSKQPWDKSEVVDTTGILPKGIYGILTDLAIADSSIVAVDEDPNQYWVVVFRNKDGWPDPKLAEWVRMKTVFPDAADSDLNLFLPARGV